MKSSIPVLFYERSSEFSPKLLKSLILFGAMFITSVMSAQTSLGPFQVREGIENPLRGPQSFPAWPAPVLEDLDRDGDKDLIVGSSSQTNGYSIHYYENEGSETNPVFIEQFSGDNPFYFVVYNFSGDMMAIKPTFTDVDNDNDLDLFVGSQSGMIRFYLNDTNWGAAEVDLDFTNQTGSWNPATKAGNPFHSIQAGYYTAPHAVDFDNDGDDDLLIGTLENDSEGDATIHLYKNDGQFNFTHSLINGVNPPGIQVTPIAKDYDKDGDLDIMTGDRNGVFRLFLNDGASNFTEQADWNIFSSFGFGEYGALAYEDLDGDDKPEFLVGNDPVSGLTLSYLKNLGNNTFEKRSGIHDPFGGIDVGGDAVPVFADVDDDNDTDILIGNRSGRIRFLRNDNGVFNLVPDAESQFASIATSNSVSISYVDLNGDEINDIIAAVDNGLRYFRGTGSAFEEITHSTGPFALITTVAEPKADFADIDNDGDFDMILSDEIPWSNGATFWGFVVRFFINVGTAENPSFQEKTGNENFFSSVSEEYTLYPRFVDVDHDGDKDVVIGEGGAVHTEVPESNEFMFFENTGSAEVFSFEYKGNLIPQYSNNVEPSAAFLDFDNDGDLDIFQGGSQGEIALYANENQAASVQFETSNVVVAEVAGELFVDANINIVDEDNDDIIRAIISINEPDENDFLTSTLPAVPDNIEITYNEVTRTMTIAGKASADVYEAIIKAVKLHYDESGSAGRKQDVVAVKSVSFLIVDADNTTASAVTKTFTIDVAVNEAPVISDATVNIFAGGIGSIELLPLITDADGNLDLTTLAVAIEPSESTNASITNGVLSISYEGKSFTGTDATTIGVCDEEGACTQRALTINVTNTAPVFADQSLSIAHAGTGTVPLMSLVEDAEDNIVTSTFSITAQPASGALASLNTNHELIVDYSGLTYSGTETLTVQVCDITGACDQGTIIISVSGDSQIIVHNAVAPMGSSELNRYLHIGNLPVKNVVTIFNRWGDVVYNVSSYSNEPGSNRFEGKNNDGKSLPSGTYFYKIEYEAVTDPSAARQHKVLTGYLSLQQ